VLFFNLKLNLRTLILPENPSFCGFICFKNSENQESEKAYFLVLFDRWPKILTFFSFLFA